MNNNKYYNKDEVIVSDNQNSEKTGLLKQLVSQKGINWYIVITAILLFLTVVMFSVSSRIALSSLEKTFEDEKSKAAQEIYDMAYDYAERKHHISNEVIINITDIQKKASLEVFEVTATEVILKNDKENKFTEWYEFSAKGIYTVDLENAEYIVDKIHKTVTVRIAKPKLTNFTLVNSDKDPLFSANKGGNDSQKDGVNLRLDAQNEAHSSLENKCRKKEYYDKAKESAQKSISALVKSFNPDVEDLIVFVEII